MSSTPKASLRIAWGEAPGFRRIAVAGLKARLKADRPILESRFQRWAIARPSIPGASPQAILNDAFSVPFWTRAQGRLGAEKSDTGILPVILSILAAALAAALNHRLEARVILGRLPPHRWSV